MRKILVAEDERNLREGIAEAFVDAGHEVVQAEAGDEALEALEEQVFDLVITDYKMPVVDGLELLRRVRMINDSTAVIMMTAYGTVEGAVQAMRLGAYDYIQKPFNLEELELKAERALEHRRLLSRLMEFDRRDLVGRFDNIVGESPAMRRVFEVLSKVAPSNATVLILGETGTGKELIAEAIHRNSTRADGPFVKINCAALPDNLLESELFGHERGAFTGADRQRVGRFELANEGTLFLDEIGTMSAGTQAKVLRVLQEREFERLGGTRSIKSDVRLIAATNRDLEAAIAAGEFREDLFYRLNVVTINMPPLRERKEDIVPLATYFLQRFGEDLKKPMHGFSPGALRALTRHNWPGNIRELENTIERAVLMADSGMIKPGDLTLGQGGGAGDERSRMSAVLRLPAEGMALEELEKMAILEALRMNDWIQKDAARFLRISSRVMNYKIQKYEITHPRWARNRSPV
ncbi:MAG: sigma-54 dependent transcriptional regulator [Acidobacteriota bacterium]|nr:sigma-54 dependent transcriptional regulator [Acidobacteriota bacterium]MDQ7087022.1 sigma-54 dependent transcriptional regulator [Acidobacteriota bacterium]